MNPCFWRKGDESLKTCEKLVNDKMDKMGKWAHNDENQSLTVSEICGYVFIRKPIFRFGE